MQENELYKIGGKLKKMYYNEVYIFQLRELIKANNKHELLVQSENIMSILNGKKITFFLSLKGAKELLVELEIFLNKLNYHMECSEFYFKIIDTNEQYHLN